jgi:hypothetical protein
MAGAGIGLFRPFIAVGVLAAWGAGDSLTIMMVILDDDSPISVDAAPA